LFDKAQKNKLRLVVGMTDALTHRGPDDKGLFFNDRVGLGHRRLSIIDLSMNAKQPMFNEDGSLALIFNGEIYNFKELREQLLAKGHIFKSNSDSEVILHLYEEYNTKCAQKLEGMFAFAVYDINHETLFIARDRVGEKPLYYYKDKYAFYFSSEIKSFFTLEHFEKKLSPEGVYAYFNNVQIPAPQTIFQGVKKFLPAHWLLLNSEGREIVEPYWHVDCTKKNKLSALEAKEHLKLLMLDSVKKMSVCDVPIGLLLSGGVDSSLILALSSELGGQDLSTFTVGNASTEIDDKEFKRAKKIASQFQTKHHEYNFGNSEFSDLIEAARLCDEPLGILEIFYMFSVNQKIKEHVKVVLTGNGADEVFGGYTGYNKTRQLADLFDIFQGVIRRNNSSLTHIAATYNANRNWKILRKLFSDELKNDKPRDLSQSLLTDIMKLVSFDNLLDAKLFMDLFVMCNHGISAIPDIGGMSYSMEFRSPFTHHKVIEFAATLPVEFKVKDPKNSLYNKFVLKELACDYLDIDDVYIQKYGYGYFINTFTLIQTKWKNEIQDLILDPLIKETGLFNISQIEFFWEQFLADNLGMKEKLILAKYIMFCVWYKYNFKNSN
ncbi:MAG: asparagine synthase (glutamine-hydrolyzing), partial [Nitrospina sp.]|nr:asparagine synthase (glutamine-hydrolyzing) [Nitrospina sp.]